MRPYLRYCLPALALLLLPLFTMARPTFPNDAKYAVSLSYDDALASQLDNAIPALQRHNMKASFYIFPHSEGFYTAVERWREVAKQGHELGNHTLYHPCNGAVAGRDWVKPFTDLRNRTVAQMRAELIIANSLLQALDGKTERTFTTPCGESQTSDGDYLAQARDLFVAFKGEGIADGSEVLHAPANMSGQQLIDLVRKVPETATVISILFHGIGGDHSAVSTQAHEALLQYLAEHPELYWVDTYMTIKKHLQQGRP